MTLTLLTSLPTVGKFAGVMVDFVPIDPATEKLGTATVVLLPDRRRNIAPDASAGTVQTLGGVKLLQKELETGAARCR